MVDPVLHNRICSRIQAGVDEAEAVFRAYAHSVSLVEGESAVSLFFPDGSLWAEGSSSAPLLSALLRTWVVALGDRFSDFGDDILVTNDPYDGGGTVCDVRMLVRVAMGDDGFGWLAICGHYPDVGGQIIGGVAPTVRSIQEEGLRIPLSVVDESLLRLLPANGRHPVGLRRNLDAQAEALGVGRAWMGRLGDAHTWEIVLEAGRSLQERARRALKAGLGELSDGTYVRRDRLDADTETAPPTHLAVALTISADEIAVNFEGSGPTSTGATNCTKASTIASVLCAFRHLFPEIPACGFAIEDLEIRVPHGSLLCAQFPTAVGGTSDVLADRVVSLVVEALSQSVHGRGRACDGGGGNIVILEGNDSQGAFALRLVVGSGGGASGRGDGLTNTDASVRHSLFPSVEAMERAFPVRVALSEERVGTGGAGRYRGGNGTMFEIEVLSPNTRLTVYADRFGRGAGGHHRGGRGETTEVAVFANGHWQTPEGIGRLHGHLASTGDRVRIQTAGGGGYGHPYERAIRLLADDVISGRLTRKDAAKEHGVVYTSSDARDYDSAKTFKLRSYRLTSSDVDDFLDEIETLQD
jgi:N-methylhydantoinase B